MSYNAQISEADLEVGYAIYYGIQHGITSEDDLVPWADRLILSGNTNAEVMAYSLRECIHWQDRILFINRKPSVGTLRFLAKVLLDRLRLTGDWESAYCGVSSLYFSWDFDYFLTGFHDVDQQYSMLPAPGRPFRNSSESGIRQSIDTLLVGLSDPDLTSH